ncbi:MAG: hypothetical protein D3923_13030 [Candidatus Electrothrix sp. AR3]|nr:hypothetical protein [Candidatus Electrothrix sp. AR3]
MHNILFIGNSLTSFNRGIPYYLERLAASADPLLSIKADAVLKGGAPLKTLWRDQKALKFINTASYDVVVLQEDIPETDVATFHKYARKFDTRIKATGARSILFMAWPYERLGWITQEEIAQAHHDIATEIGIKHDVAPVGLAWQRALEEGSNLDMYSSDQEHPSIYGTYLSTYVLYATIFGRSPVGLSYPFSSDKIRKYIFKREWKQWQKSKQEMIFLQRIAWETVQEYQVQHKPDNFC